VSIQPSVCCVLVSVECNESSRCRIVAVFTVASRQQESEAAAVAEKGERMNVTHLCIYTKCCSYLRNLWVIVLVWWCEVHNHTSADNNRQLSAVSLWGFWRTSKSKLNCWILLLLLLHIYEHIKIWLFIKNKQLQCFMLWMRRFIRVCPVFLLIVSHCYWVKLVHCVITRFSENVISLAFPSLDWKCRIHVFTNKKKQLHWICALQAIRKIPRIPFKVLDAPELQDDFYLNLVDWSSQNILSVGLGSCVYLWSACTSQVPTCVWNLYFLRW